MRLLLALLLASAALAADVPGEIWVEAPPGATVFLDGKFFGNVMPGTKGVMLRAVAPGKHKVVVRAQRGGGSVEVPIEVRTMETSRVRVSQLALMARKQLDVRSGDVRVTSTGMLCSFTLGNWPYEMTSMSYTATNVPAGKYTMDASCGRLKLRGDIEVKDNSIALVTIDPDRGTIRLTGQQERAVRVTVAGNSRHDSIMQLDVPAEWKRALVAAVISGVDEVAARKNGAFTVRLSMRCANPSVAARAVEILKLRDEVATIEMESLDYTSKGLRMVATVTFFAQ